MTQRSSHGACFGIFAACLLLVPSLVRGGSASHVRVAVVVGKHAPPIEQFAARELTRYLAVLFGIRAEAAVPSDCSKCFAFLVGNPSTNPAVAAAIGSHFPRVGEQGIVLRPVRGGHSFITAGGSPRGTLWAVYALVERWGVHYLLHGDILPKRAEFRPPTFDIVQEPVFRIRQWRVVNEFAMGPASWGIADYRPVLDQLAKLRFNRILIYVWPHQPFLDYATHGIARSSATMFFGFHFPITPDMAGRRLFGSRPEFWNPDLPLDGSYREFHEAAREHLRKLIAYARQRGMTCVLGLTATEFPPEFAPLFKDPQKVHQVGGQTIVPGSKTDIDDPILADLSRAVLNSAVTTYPNVQYIDLGMQEWRQWIAEYRRAWNGLDKKYHLGGEKNLAKILAAAHNRSNYYGAGRAEDEVKGDIVSIYFYDHLLSHRGGLARPTKFVLDSVAEELFPYLDRMAPWASETLNSVDYTPARILRRRETLRQIAAGRLPAALIYTLQDDNVGILPQLETGSLHKLDIELRRDGWVGFSTRYWLIGEQDPCVAYLAKAAWKADTTPEQVYRDQLRAVCGAGCVEPMLGAFQELEAATHELELHALGITFPVPGMAMKFWKRGAIQPEFINIRQRYERALKFAEAASAKQSGTNREYVNYYVGRLRFGVLYFRMIAAMRKGATAEARGDRDGALREARLAHDLARQSIEEYARVARDQSDRGAIATLDEFVDRPLKDKVQALKSETRP